MAYRLIDSPAVEECRLPGSRSDGMSGTGRGHVANRRGPDDDQGKGPPNDPTDVPETPQDEPTPAPAQEPPDPETPPYVVDPS